MAIWLVLALLFAAAAVVRFELPQLPLADSDTPGYINPAFGKLLGLGYVHEHGRNFVYPGFVYLLLATFRDMRAIAVAQHILGLLTGALLWFTWTRSWCLTKRASTPLWFRLLGLVLVRCFLSSTKPILYESQVRAESVFSFVAMVSLAMNVQFIRFRFLDHRPRSAMAYGILTLFVSVLMHCLRPSWGFGIVFASLPVLLSLFDGRESLQRKLTMVATAGTCIFVLLVLPEHLLAREDREAKTFGARVVFAVHADMIRDQIRADLAQGKDLPYPAEWLTSMQEALDEDIRRTASDAQDSLGFNSDYIMWQNSSFNKLYNDLHGDPDEISKFCWSYYRRVALHQPARLASKIGRQLSVFYRIPSPVYQKRESREASLDEQFQRSSRIFGSYTAKPTMWEGLPKYLKQLQGVLEKHQAIRASPLFAWIHYPLSLLYLPLLGMAALLNIWAVCNRQFRDRFGFPAFFVLLIFLYNFGHCLTVAVVHTLEVRRFGFVQLSFTMLAEFLALALIIDMLLHYAPAVGMRLKGGGEGGDQKNLPHEI